RRDVAPRQDGAPRRRPELGAHPRGGGPEWSPILGEARLAPPRAADPREERHSGALSREGRGAHLSEGAGSRRRGSRSRRGHGLEAGLGPRTRLCLVERRLPELSEKNKKRGPRFPAGLLVPGFQGVVLLCPRGRSQGR